MARIDHEAKRITIKVVYWGPPSSGKWSNLEHIHRRTSPPDRVPARKEQSLGFPLQLGDIRGYSTHFALLRSPNQGPIVAHVFDEIGAQPPDGFVFVVDSSADALIANLASMHSLVKELGARNLDLAKLPAVFQYNKRDLAGALSVEQLRGALNSWKHPDFEATASQGLGVFETVKQVAKQILGGLRG